MCDMLRWVGGKCSRRIKLSGLGRDGIEWGDAWEWGLPGLCREVARDLEIHSFPGLGLGGLTTVSYHYTVTHKFKALFRSLSKV